MVPAIVLVFLASSDVDSATGEALARGMTEALGSPVQISLRGFETIPNTATMAQAGRADSAEAVARVVWQDLDSRLNAHITLVAAGSDGTTLVHERSISFTTADPLAERGRSLGFLIAAFVLSHRTKQTPVPADPSLVADRVPATTAADAQADPRWTMEAFGVLAVPLADAGGGLGGGVAGRWRGGERWAARAGVRAQTTTVDVAQATYLGIAICAGGSRILAGKGLGLGPALALRLDAQLLHESVTHFSDDDPEPVRRGRWVPGAATLMELDWPLGRSSAIHVAAGLEAVFGVTSVLVRQNQVTRIGPWRLLAEVGLLTRF